MTPEQEWLNTFAQKMNTPTPQELDFFKTRREEGKGVGLDEHGTLIYGRPN